MSKSGISSEQPQVERKLNTGPKCIVLQKQGDPDKLVKGGLWRPSFLFAAVPPLVDVMEFLNHGLISKRCYGRLVGVCVSLAKQACIIGGSQGANDRSIFHPKPFLATVLHTN